MSRKQSVFKHGKVPFEIMTGCKTAIRSMSFGTAFSATKLPSIRIASNKLHRRMAVTNSSKRAKSFGRRSVPRKLPNFWRISSRVQSKTPAGRKPSGSIPESALIQFSKSAQSPATENYRETSGMVRIAGLEPAKTSFPSLYIFVCSCVYLLLPATSCRTIVR